MSVAVVRLHGVGVVDSQAGILDLIGSGAIHGKFGRAIEAYLADREASGRPPERDAAGGKW
ncbi:MAG: hypothetical protein ACLPY3_11495 [Solirubrobacteraceae bacterium]